MGAKTLIKKIDTFLQINKKKYVGTKILHTLIIIFFQISHLKKASILFRNSLPLEMQHGCAVVYPAVLHNTIEHKDTYEKRETLDLPFVMELFGPQSSEQHGKKKITLSFSKM